MSLFFDDHTPSRVSVSFTNSSLSPIVSLAEKYWPAERQSPAPLCVQSVQTGNRRALICWAQRDDTVDGLELPPEWNKLYPHVFRDSGSPVVSISPTELVLLTEVIVMALSTHAYQIACEQESILEEWFCMQHTILRQGDVHTLNQLPCNGNGDSSLSVTYSYRLGLVEPVLQGYARKGVTRFIVVLSEERDPGHASAETDTAEGDNEAIEIDEAFLAKSTVSHAFDSNGTATETANVLSQDTGISFSTMPLSRPVELSEDQCTLYVRTVDLSKIGIQNGDWALVRPSATAKCRLVKVSANDELVPTVGTVAGSPVLLRNLFPENATHPNVLCIRSSPFGSRQPAVPNAQSLTIARVASPVSTSRTYQPLFLKALKVYFDSTKRLVKQGDIIAVPIDTGDSVPETESQETLDDSPKFPAFPSRSNEIVFFCVTNIEYALVKHAYHDVCNGSTVGELGCWVDSSITRIVQSGVEHSWIPSVGTYFETEDPSSRGTLYSTLSRHKSSHLLGPDSPYHILLQFMSATSAQQAMDYRLDMSMLLKGARGIGKFTIASWVAERLGMHLLEASVVSLPFLSSINLENQINCYDVIGETDTKTEGTLRARFDKAKTCSPCVLLLRHVEALTQSTQALEPGKEPAIANALKECIADAQEDWKITGYPVVILGTTSQPSRIPPTIVSSFKHEISFEAPGERERFEILESTQTAALVASDLADLVSRARFASIDRVVRSGAHPAHSAKAGIALTTADFEVALGKSRASYSESIGAPKIPNVTWDDVGGLAHVKADILDTIQLPLEHPELFSDGLKKRSGILLYGPPGTGKTLLAKAVATSCSLNFFSVKGPELLNMYIGESEANVRRVFQRARDAKPCVIFFDELDSVAPKRGNQGDSGGVMDRIVSQLLAELDGMSTSKGGADVFVIGATNRPDLLDPALLRPGRFDRMLYLGVSETHEAQKNILEALTRKFQLAPDLDLYQVAEQCPFNYTGADFYALCSDAMLNAMSRKAKTVDNKIAQLNVAPGIRDYPIPLTPQYFLAEMASESDINVLVSGEDFDQALKDLIPSVSQSEMDHYAEIQHRFAKDKVQIERT
ncbi:hypothetical protein C0993_008046 [Termitomyces sp. T159_Od127]|nr:hypothetical protein C0993_008046 [Termitomyces sp. T159_Od127]